MRKSLLTSLMAAAALGVVFLLGAPADKAAAMMSATPNQIGVPSSDDNLMEKAALVCGRLGCRRVWAGRRVWSGAHRAWWGVHRAAWWGARRVAWWHHRVWWGARRYAWGPRRYWWGVRQAAWRPRPLFAYAGSGYAGPASGLGWFNPGLSVTAWSGPGWGGGWGGPGPGWGWSSWSGPGWGGGWGLGFGWRRPWWGWGGW